MLETVFNPIIDGPILSVVIGFVLTIAFAMPISVGLGFSHSLQPVRDLAKGAERVAAGDYSQRLPVVQDDDLGALAASFNRMQAGLAERQRLQGAFGRSPHESSQVAHTHQRDRPPGHVLVGSIACSCGRHLTWRCECGAVTYGPAFGEGCSLLNGPARMRG
jgi:HAMP domain-containing protein